MRGNAPYNASRDLYKPDYKILSDYSHLINESIAGMYIEDAANLPNTLAQIVLITRQYAHQTRKLAYHLKSQKGHLQTCYNIWHFLKMNVKYKTDTLGVEEIRTPSRSWYDRRKGIDCEDFTIFAASILKMLGYEANLYVIDYDNKNDEFDHIFCTSKGIIIDPVWEVANEKPKGKEINNIEYRI